MKNFFQVRQLFFRQHLVHHNDGVIHITAFNQVVLPGDTLIFKLELAGPIRRGICHMHGEAYVGDKVVMEAEMMAQIVRKEKNDSKNGAPK